MWLLWEYDGKDSEASRSFSTMGLSDKFDLVLQVATKVQVTTETQHN